MTITNGKLASEDYDLFLETGHSLLGPSSAKRWLTCTPSARLGESIPDPGTTSPYALDGTAAHTFAEIRVNWKLGGIDFTEYSTRLDQAKIDWARQIAEWTHSDWEAIDEYVEYCIGEVERLGGNYLQGGDAVWEAERAVTFEEFVPMGKGTADFTIVNTKLGVIKAIDLKFGKGIAVDARDNEQAKLYALGLACANGPGDPSGRAIGSSAQWFDIRVEWAIVQPRLNYIGEDSTDLGALVTWAEDYVKPRADMAWRGEGVLNPSEEACRYCKVAPTCIARFEKMRDEALASFGVEFIEEKGKPLVSKVTQEPKTITPEHMGDLLPKLDAWIKWASDVQERALVMARDEGLEIPGYKLVRGRSNRGWNPGVEDLDERVIQTLVAAGFPETELLTPPKPPELKSVAQIEKVVGAAKLPKLLGELVVKPLGKPALVPESDRREALTPEKRADEALADFGVVFEGGDE